MANDNQDSSLKHEAELAEMAKGIDIAFATEYNCQWEPASPKVSNAEINAALEAALATQIPDIMFGEYATPASLASARDQEQRAIAFEDFYRRVPVVPPIPTANMLPPLPQGAYAHYDLAGGPPAAVAIDNAQIAVGSAQTTGFSAIESFDIIR